MLRNGKVIGYIKNSSSTPIIIENQNGKYFVKLKSGFSGKHGVISEWIVSNLAFECGINIDKPELIFIDNEVIIEQILDEVIVLIEKSYGINIAYKFHNSTKNITKESINQLSCFQKNQLFMFDLIVLNIDRNLTNLNLFKVKNEIYSCDFEACFLINNLIESKEFFDNKKVLEELRRNPFYKSELNSLKLLELLKKISKINMKEIIDEMPLEWFENENNLSNNFREYDSINLIKHNIIEWFFEINTKIELYKKLFSEISEIVLETEEEMKQRMYKNRIEFQNKFN
ncbi:MAG: hypothetical protein IPP08_09115 [Chlorobiota bacterium]|nr:MAG: hypothetical protein IPP08_09115 [Chlorobiota bacterium]